jgi:hypothetical protein
MGPTEGRGCRLWRAGRVLVQLTIHLLDLDPRDSFSSFVRHLKSPLGYRHLLNIPLHRNLHVRYIFPVTHEILFLKFRVFFLLALHLFFYSFGLVKRHGEEFEHLGSRRKLPCQVDNS